MEIISDEMCFACGKKNPIGLKLEFREINDRYVAEFIPRPELQGYKNVLHGGIVSTLLDEAMANYLYHKGLFVVTAEMTVKFKKPIPTTGKLIIEGWLTNHKGRIYEMNAQIIIENGVVGAEAKAKFLEPKNKIIGNNKNKVI